MCQNDPLIKHDCDLIVDAIRRLRYGTWDLNGEDLDFAQVLVPQIRSALKDHVRIEELTIFPHLPNEAKEAHRAEHHSLLALLWSLEQSLLQKEPLHFHSLLDLLNEFLAMHHNNCRQNLGSDDGAIANLLSSFNNLSTRYQRKNLEPL
jgi:hemerythrin